MCKIYCNSTVYCCVLVLVIALTVRLYVVCRGLMRVTPLCCWTLQHFYTCRRLHAPPAVTHLPHSSIFAIFITFSTHLSSLLRTDLGHLFISSCLHLSEPWLWLGFKDLQLVGGLDTDFKVTLLLWFKKNKKNSPSKERRDVLTGELTSLDHLRTWAWFVPEHERKKERKTSATVPPRDSKPHIKTTSLCWESYCRGYTSYLLVWSNFLFSFFLFCGLSLLSVTLLEHFNNKKSYYTVFRSWKIKHKASLSKVRSWARVTVCFPVSV